MGTKLNKKIHTTNNAKNGIINPFHKHYLANKQFKYGTDAGRQNRRVTDSRSDGQNAIDFNHNPSTKERTGLMTALIRQNTR